MKQNIALSASALALFTANPAFSQTAVDVLPVDPNEAMEVDASAVEAAVPDVPAVVFAPLMQEMLDTSTPVEARKSRAAELQFENFENLPGIEDARPRILHNNELLHHDFHDNPHSGKLKRNWMAAHFIDVGQGAATLFEFSCGAVLIDTGGQDSSSVNGSEKLQTYIKQFFSRRSDLNNTLDLLLITHPHKDHVLGLTASKRENESIEGLLTLAGNDKINIKNIVTNAETSGSGWSQQKALLDYAKNQSIPSLAVSNTDIKRSDGLTNGIVDPINCSGTNPSIRLLWGSADRRHSWAGKKHGNNHSVVVRLDFGQSSFLITGDLEEKAQPELIRSYKLNPDILDVDVYQVGHHASANGTTRQLVDAMTPEIAVIGAGDPSDDSDPNWTAFAYGHPNAKALKVLTNSKTGVELNRTPGVFPVGLRGRYRDRPSEWEYQTIEKAIYSTGWDGDIVITADLAGKKLVHKD